MTVRIELKDVTVAHEGSTPIFEALNAKFRDGEIVGLVSAVGGGKSTFLKICAGLIKPTSGEVMIGGSRFWSLTDLERNRIRRRMGFDFQEGALIANMTVYQNLALPLRYHGKMPEEQIPKAIDEWLERMHVARYRDVLPAALSAGLKRRVSYIRLMMTDGEYLFWDEPTEGSDERHARLIAETLERRKSEGAGSLVSTQNGTFLRRIADRVMVLDDGRIAYDGPLERGRLPVELEAEGMLRD